MLIRSEERRTAVWQLRSARLSLRIGSPSTAWSEIDRLVNASIDNGSPSPATLRLAFDIQFEQKQYAEARHFAQLGLLLWPDKLGFIERLAKLELCTGSPSAAMALVKPIAQADRTRIRARTILAAAYERLDDHVGALNTFEELLNLKSMSRDLDLRVHCAQAARRAHQPERGLRVLAPLLRPPLSLRAALLHQSGQLLEALELYDYILVGAGIVSAINPTDESLNPLHSMLLGQSNGTNATFESMTEGDLLESSVARIAILRELGDRPALESLARWELHNLSDDPTVRTSLGEALVALGNTRLALDLIRADRHNVQVGPRIWAILLVIAEVEDRAQLAFRCAQYLRKHGHQELILWAEKTALMSTLLAQLDHDDLTSIENDDSQMTMPIAPRTRLQQIMHRAHVSLVRVHRSTCCDDEFRDHILKLAGALDLDANETLPIDLLSTLNDPAETSSDRRRLLGQMRHNDDAIDAGSKSS